jgi:hypothetical protein
MWLWWQRQLACLHLTTGHEPVSLRLNYPPLQHCSSPACKPQATWFAAATHKHSQHLPIITTQNLVIANQPFPRAGSRRNLRATRGRSGRSSRSTVSRRTWITWNDDQDESARAATLSWSDTGSCDLLDCCSLYLGVSGCEFARLRARVHICLTLDLTVVDTQNITYDPCIKTLTGFGCCLCNAKYRHGCWTVNGKGLPCHSALSERD